MTPPAGAVDGPGRRLARVHVSPDRVVRTVVGLRPFRRSGFRVESEALGDTLLVHNYGHGGCGVTLSWGTARLAVDLIAASGRAGAAAVIGSGAVGLATARLLQERGTRVTIYARELPPETTSNVAGALWYPYLIADEGRRTAAFDAQLADAARFSHRHFQRLLGSGYGVCWRQQYFLSATPPEEPWEAALVRDLFPAAQSLAPAEHPFGAPHVVFDRLLFIDPAVYLNALLREFQLAGGRVQTRAFASAADVAALPEQIVVNCSGLGARELFGDRDLMPVKGQLTVLPPQPDIDYAWVNDDHLYMFPRDDGILLGGTQEEGVDTLEPDREAERRILAAHKAVVDAMR